MIVPTDKNVSCLDLSEWIVQAIAGRRVCVCERVCDENDFELISMGPRAVSPNHLNYWIINSLYRNRNDRNIVTRNLLWLWQNARSVLVRARIHMAFTSENIYCLFDFEVLRFDCNYILWAREMSAPTYSYTSNQHTYATFSVGIGDEFRARASIDGCWAERLWREPPLLAKAPFCVPMW